MAYPTTTATGIILSIPKPSTGNYQLEITEFGQFAGVYPRIEPQYLDIEYSTHGGRYRTGPAFRPKAVWTFEAGLTLEQQEALKRMEAVYLANPQPWTIYDYTNPFNEVGTASMGLAPNSTSADDGDTVLYYPVWQAEPSQAFPWREDPRTGVDFVSFQFKEV